MVLIVNGGCHNVYGDNATVAVITIMEVVVSILVGVFDCNKEFVVMVFMFVV